MHIDGIRDEMDFLPKEGGLMGHTLVAPDFVDVYNDEVQAWMDELAQCDETYTWMEAEDPVTKQTANVGLGQYVDDTSVINAHLDDEGAKAIARKLNGITSKLSNRVGRLGASLNQQKTMAALNIFGKGAQDKERKVNSGAAGFCGQTGRHVRLLGPYLHTEGHINQEIKNMIKAARKGWRQLGNIWKEKIPMKLKKVLFISHVQEALLSGMTAFVVTDKQCSDLDSAVAPMLRLVLQGKAAKRDHQGNAIKVLSNEQVRKKLRVAPSTVELRTRRVRYLQRVVKFEGDHVQFRAAVLGKMKLEESLGSTLKIHGSNNYIMI